MRHIVLVSGRTTNGKTKLASNLRNYYDFEVLKTSLIITNEANKRGLKKDREALKNLGDILDEETNFKWILEEVHKLDRALKSDLPIVVDSIRKAEQLDTFRKQLEFDVTHVHLYASKEALVSRFEQRKKAGHLPRNTTNHNELDLVKSEEDIEVFRDDADVRINTLRTDNIDTLHRVAAYLGLYSPPDRRCVDVLIGGQYGSEGKGQVAAYLSREYDVLIRVGGPNAGHKAAREKGKYTYHSLPSGSRESNADILIGAGATIHLEEFIKEVEECRLSPERVFLDPNAMVITDEDRKKEMGLKRSIGSTGRGGGYAAARRITHRLNDENRAKLSKDYPELKQYVKSVHRRLQGAYSSGERVFLEGTQGSLLSLYHGPYPFVTSRDTNVSGCLSEAGIPPRRVNRVLMVVRFTPIRVQSPDDSSSGELKHETDFLTIAIEAGISENLKKLEKTSTTKLNRRVGWFEWGQFRVACELNSPTDIVLTFADYQHVENREARRFEQLHVDTIKFVEELERVAQAPVSIINTRYPHEEDRPLDLRTLIDRRHWRPKIKKRDSAD